MKKRDKRVEENREILHPIVYGVEFLVKQGLAFRGHREDKVDFADASVNKGNS